jgi:two-component system LytT family response regulator
MPGIALVGKTGDPQHGLEMIRTLSPDVVLLDVEMPELTGFELIESLGVPQRRRAAGNRLRDRVRSLRGQSLRISAVDYLLKPVERGRLHEALGAARVRRELRTRRHACRSCARSSTACAPTAAAAAPEEV